MAKATMKFKKGDGGTHYVRVPSDVWSAGGSLQFAAKTVPDNDATDASAVIKKSFDDTTIVDSLHDEYVAGKVTYELEFVAADTNAITFTDGSKKKRYLGEFQFVPLTGSPVSSPAADDYIDVIVYADIKRGTS